MDWTVLLYVLGAALMLWVAFRIIKTKPELFTKANFSKSVSTLGVLALILIGVVAFCVLLLKS